MTTDEREAVGRAYDMGYRRAVEHMTPDANGKRVWRASDRENDLRTLLRLVEQGATCQAPSSAKPPIPR